MGRETCVFTLYKYTDAKICAFDQISGDIEFRHKQIWVTCHENSRVDPLNIYEDGNFLCSSEIEFRYASTIYQSNVVCLQQAHMHTYTPSRIFDEYAQEKFWKIEFIEIFISLFVSVEVTTSRKTLHLYLCISFTWRLLLRRNILNKQRCIL